MTGWVNMDYTNLGGDQDGTEVCTWEAVSSNGNFHRDYRASFYFGVNLKFVFKSVIPF